jgi:hypothetical protein
MLFKKGEFLMAGYGRFIGSLASHLRVQARVKILTEAGKRNGELVLDHSSSIRLRDFSGRTVLPDGRIVPVPADARFERRTSQTSRTFVTAVAFPAVQVGAILDYQYEIVFSTPFLLEPWAFSEEMPVRHAEVVFKTAHDWRMQVWTRAPLGVKLQQEKQETSAGYELRVWAENLPAIPEVPYGPAYADLASPAGWRLDRRPQQATLDGPCGEFSSNLALDAEARSLVYSRRLDLTRRKLAGKEEYELVRALFGAAASNDAQTLTLVRR